MVGECRANVSSPGKMVGECRANVSSPGKMVGECPANVSSPANFSKMAILASTRIRQIRRRVAIAWFFISSSKILNDQSVFETKIRVQVVVS
jgi:hypothetical protein